MIEFCRRPPGFAHLRVLVRLHWAHRREPRRIGRSPDRRDQAFRKGWKQGDISVIQHIVFIIKENRSFDEYFGLFPGVDGATKSQSCLPQRT